MPAESPPQMQELQAQIRDIAGQFSTILGSISTIGARVAQDMELILDLQRLRTDLMERMDRISNDIERMHEDIWVNMVRADRAHEVAINVRTELHELSKQAEGMFRQIHRLQTEVQQLKDKPSPRII